MIVASSSSQAARRQRLQPHSASDSTRKGSNAAEAAADKHDERARTRSCRPCRRFERTHQQKLEAQIAQRAAEQAKNQMASTDAERVRRVCVADMPSVETTLSIGKQFAKTGINKSNDPDWKPEFEVNMENAQRVLVFAKKLQDWFNKKCHIDWSLQANMQELRLCQMWTGNVSWKTRGPPDPKKTGNYTWNGQPWRPQSKRWGKRGGKDKQKQQYYAEQAAKAAKAAKAAGRAAVPARAEACAPITSHPQLGGLTHAISIPPWRGQNGPPAGPPSKPTPPADPPPRHLVGGAATGGTSRGRMLLKPTPKGVGI